VGVEKISEQYIEGEGRIHGTQRIAGQFTGSNNPFVLPGQNQGSIYGRGSIDGHSEIRTKYKYATRFFIRETTGVDTPFVVYGEHLPILDGHEASAIYVFNKSGESLVVAIVNHTTKLSHSLVSSGWLIDHLGIPKYRTVRRQVYSQELKQQELRRHLRNSLPKIPWLWLACACGGVLGFLGILLKGRFSAVGWMFAIVGIATCCFSAIWLAMIYFQTNQIKSKPLYKDIRIANNDVSIELSKIESFIEGALLKD